jgi:hypothetical protein
MESWAHDFASHPVNWNSGDLQQVQSDFTGVTILPARRGVQLGPIDTSERQITLSLQPAVRRTSAIRVRCSPAERSAKVRWSELRASLIVADGKKQPVKLHLTGVNSGHSLNDVRKLLDGPRRTAFELALNEKQTFEAIFELNEPLPKPDGKDLRLEVSLWLESASEPTQWQIDLSGECSERLVPSTLEALARQEPTRWTTDDRKWLTALYASKQSEYQELGNRLAELTRNREASDTAVPTTLVMDELAKPRETFILMRGEYDKLGTKVTAATPGVLPPMRGELPRNRLGLARWLVDPQNPLPARVTVNRMWQLLFGVGLVKTAEDFGSQGEPPSHPELVDWLASEFISSGWDTKAMLRLIVTSETYKQSSKLSPALRERDPENRLLARGPRFRLQGEFIRDQALAASGLLVRKLGGPSVKPYHPPGLYEQVTAGTGTNVYVQDHADNLHRRSMYTYWKRSVPNPAMLLFDSPFRESCTLRRTRTNTPLQALNLLNDPTYVEAARALAQRMLLEGGQTFESQLTYGFQLMLARSPRSTEIALLKASYQHAVQDFQKDQAAAAELIKVGEAPVDSKANAAQLAALTTIASTILNLDEAVTKE